MENVSKKKWTEVRKKLPKNYREEICQMHKGLTKRQVSMVITGESKNLKNIKKVRSGIRKVLLALGHSKEQVDAMGGFFM